MGEVISFPRLNISIDDARTLALVHEYRRFIANLDGVFPSHEEAIEGLILFALDEHEAFAHWRYAARLSKDLGPTHGEQVTCARAVE